jgi:predicted nucleic acid-binding protein
VTIHHGSNAPNSADAPMDLADASLVVTAENLRVNHILTFDAHFHAYRINGKLTFEVLP